MKRIFATIFFATGIICSFAQSEPMGLQVGAKAPEFSAKNQSGETISLTERLRKKKVVLVFYRGQWCPYCNKALSNLEDSLSFITAKGAELIAITPEVGENIVKTVEKTKATYPILHDEDQRIMKAYDVAYSLDPAMVEKYKGYGIDFNNANGSNGASLPVPAVYVVDQDGVIRYRYFNPDYTKRATVKDILDHL